MWSQARNSLALDGLEGTWNFTVDLLRAQIKAKLLAYHASEEAAHYTDQVDAFSQALKRAFTDRRGKMGVGIIEFDGRINWLTPKAGR